MSERVIFMKKIIIALILAIMFGNMTSVYAYNYPSSFCSINSKYEAAVNSNDYANIIAYGNQIITLMQNSADGPEKQNILVTRYNQIGLAYAALGDY